MKGRRRKKRRVLRGIRRLGTILLLLMLLAILVPAARRIEGNVSGSREQGKQGEVLKIEVKSPYAVLIRREDGHVLFEKNSGEKMYPASLTKMMTVLVALEELEDLEEEILLPEELFQPLYAQGASMAGFQPGERVKARDLLYGAMLPSGAECCQGLALNIAGSEAGFVELMNQKADALKMNHTHFANTTGLSDDDHYSTAADMAKLLDYALDNDTFREIFTASRHSTGGTNVHPEGITFYSTLSEKLSDPAISGGKILGGKTGYTSQAGLCLASLAEKGGKEYIFVSAGAEGNHETEPVHVEDAVAAYGEITR